MSLCMLNMQQTQRGGQRASSAEDPEELGDLIG